MTPKEAIETIKVAIAEVEWNLDYAIAFEKAIEALEKQIPKKPIAIETDFYGNSYECPVCGLDMGHYEFNYCDNCGQRLKWGEDDD